MSVTLHCRPSCNLLCQLCIVVVEFNSQENEANVLMFILPIKENLPGSCPVPKFFERRPILTQSPGIVQSASAKVPGSIAQSRVRSSGESKPFTDTCMLTNQPVLHNNYSCQSETVIPFPSYAGDDLHTYENGKSLNQSPSTVQGLVVQVTESIYQVMGLCNREIPIFIQSSIPTNPPTSYSTGSNQSNPITPDKSHFTSDSLYRSCAVAS